VERSPQDRLELVGIAVDGGEGNDHVEDLLDGEVIADVARAVDDAERSAGGERPVAVPLKNGLGSSECLSRAAPTWCLLLKNACQASSRLTT
jgi:hypothetical protein